jgi:putative DNA primase/helicase
MFKYQSQFEAILGVGLNPDAKGEAMVRCPLHEDKRPSMATNSEKGIWFCHAGCGGGTVHELGQRLGKTIRWEERNVVMNEPRMVSDAIEQFHAALSVEPRAYWHKRGVNDEVLNKTKIGYDPNTRFYIFPYDDEQGNYWAYKNINDKKDEFWYPKGAEGIRLFNIRDIAKARDEGVRLYIAEGEKDSLVLIMCGYRCIGVSGVNGFKDEYASLFYGIKDIVICYDNDPPGQINGKKIAELIGCRARLLIWRDGDPKDINDLYLKDRENFKTDFECLAQNAKSQAKPFLSPACQSFDEIVDYCRHITENKIIGIPTGFYKLDRFIGGQL